MLKSETRTVINLLQERPPSTMTVKRVIILLMRLDAQTDRLYKELNETAKKQYINGRNDGIRGFAERLKESLDGKTEPTDEYDIDYLVKEMTEGTP